MRIGIIGAGMIGETLARRMGQLGHQVAIANSRGPETLRDLFQLRNHPELYGQTPRRNAAESH